MIIKNYSDMCNNKIIYDSLTGVREKDISYDIIGLDPSLTGFGVCCYEHSTDTINAFTIRLPTKGPERLQSMFRILRKIIYLNHNSKYVVESYGYSPTTSNIFQLGQLHGLIQVIAYSAIAPLLYVTPSQLKKYITGKGTAPKEDIKLAVYKKYGWEGEDNNQVDAYSLMQIGRRWFNLETAEPTKYEKDVMLSLKKYTDSDNPAYYEVLERQNRSLL